MTPALDLTLAAVALHGWQVVLLRPRAKKPTGEHWTITTDINVIRRHVERGGNVGLPCGAASGVDVLDFDDLAAADALFAELGKLPRHVRTGSGKYHCYARHEDGLPATLRYHARVIGQIQRGPGLQQVVMPPSIHPNTRQPYRWLVNPCEPLPALPEAWRAYLLDTQTTSAGQPIDLPWGTIRASDVRPNALPEGDMTGADFDDKPWDGPPAEELLRRALHQPGARQRSSGIKFQCAGCRAEGHDQHMDNAIVMNDGRWGCAVNSEHRGAIGEALGVIVADRPNVPAALRGLRVLQGLRGL